MANLGYWERMAYSRKFYSEPTQNVVYFPFHRTITYRFLFLNKFLNPIGYWNSNKGTPILGRHYTSIIF